MIITIGNQKGGTGKTTIAYNLSIMRSRRKNVLAIDCDPQDSLTDLFEIRQHKPKPVCVQVIGGGITAGIRKVTHDFDDIVLDMPGQDNEILLQALLLSDVFLVPFRASRLDFMALENMDNIAAAAQDKNPNLKALAVLSMTPTHAGEKETKHIRYQFKKYDTLKLLPCQICDRIIYRHSVDSGKAIFECSDKKAIEEMQELYRRIF